MTEGERKMDEEFEILIVDDEADLALNLHSIVEMEGYKASVAHDGKSALKIFRNRNFGLALVDIKLPDLSGIELVEKMTELSSETDYIIITGNASLGTAIEAVKQDNILSYEIKPVDIDRLLVFIKQVAERKQVEKALGATEQRYRHLFENMSSGVAVYKAVDDGKDFIFKDFNKAGEKIENIKRKDIIGKRVTEAFPGVKDFGLFEILQEVWRTGKAEYFPAAAYKDGRDPGSWRESWIYKLPTGEVVAVYNDVTERMQAEEDLKRSEERFRSTLDNMMEGCQIIGYDWRYLYVNDVATKQSWQPRDKLLGRTMMEAYPGIEKTKMFAVFKECMEKRTSYGMENEFVYPDGSKQWFELSIQPVPEGVFILSIDISERKQAEESIKESEERYRMLFNSVNDAILVRELVEKKEWSSYKEVNDIACQRYGYDREELKLLKPDDLRATDLPKNSDVIKNLLKNDKVVFETIHKAKKGEIFPVEVSSHLFQYKGKPTIISIVRDITERKKAEKALAESEERYRNLVENLNDAIFNLDNEGKISYISPIIETMSDYKMEELIGRSFTELVHPDDLPGLVNSYEKTIRGELEPYEFRVLRKSGTYTYVSTSSRPVYKDGELMGISGVLSDITEKKRMQEQLLQTEKLSSLGGIISGVAHELNNPLAAIIGNTQLLMRREIPKEIKDKLETIKKESIRSSKIIGGLLSFAREHKSERKMIDINNIIRESCKLREYELRMDNIQFDLDLSDKVEETSADPYQLQQVFVNIINNSHNALKSKKGGRLVIRSYERNDKIFVEIEDNGPGIPKENIKKVFDPFFTTKEVGEGTGLGLSIVYGIIKKHGGTIYVDSNVDKGTKVTIELPVIKDFSEEEKVETGRPKKPEGVKSVLVVEDEDSLREYVSEALLIGGYTVETCSGGEEAIKLLNKNTGFEAIVSDMKMPGLSGQNLYTFVQKECPKLAERMLFITGDVLGKETQNFLKVTGVKFVEKPFTIDELLNELSDIFEE